MTVTLREQATITVTRLRQQAAASQVPVRDYLTQWADELEAALVREGSASVAQHKKSEE